MSSNMLSDDHIMRRVLATRQDPSSFSLSPQLFGLEHVQKKLDAAVERSEYHQQYFASWHPEQDQGILLYGPQDTGKTASVFHLAAKSKLPLFVVSHADILFPLQGDSEKFLKLLFAQAAAAAPSILFFEGIESLLRRPTREDSSGSTIQSIFKQQWTYQLSTTSAPVIVIGATNCPWDMSMTGFDRCFTEKIYLRLPSFGVRQAFTRHILQHIFHDISEAEQNSLASDTSGLSPCEIRILFEDAIEERTPYIKRSQYYKKIIKDEMQIWIPCKNADNGAHKITKRALYLRGDIVKHAPLTYKDVWEEMAPPMTTRDELRRYDSFDDTYNGRPFAAASTH